MKPTIAFLVKNGIGYGHLRRALVLAEAVHTAGHARPVIISQATTVDLLRTTNIPVINFPLIQHLPNDIAADWYTEVLDTLLARLDPAVIVEDTYPDPRYLSLPTLRDRPRVLVLRRLDGLSFDTIRTSGRLAAYDKILIAQDREAFALEGHSPATLTAVEVSGRFDLVGQIYRTPGKETVARIRAQYCADGHRLVVVSAGAGGDQMPDGYGDRLFHACDQVAERLHHDGLAVHFVLVTGPYYAGRPVRERDMVSVTRFEPLLPELLAAADLVIIKPGHNATSEALCGHAHLILVPDVSYMEDLDEHSRRLTQRYGGAVATPDAACLEPLVRGMLEAPARPACLSSCDTAIGRVLDSLAALSTTTHITIAQRPVVLLLKPPPGTAPESLRALLPDSLSGMNVIGAEVPLLAGIEAGQASDHIAVLVDTTPKASNPAALAQVGVRLLIGQRDDPAFVRWSRLPANGPALLSTYASTVMADPARPYLLHRHLQQAVARDEIPVVCLDLVQLRRPEELDLYLDELATWLTRQPLQLLSATGAAALLAQHLLEGK